MLSVGYDSAVSGHTGVQIGGVHNSLETHPALSGASRNQTLQAHIKVADSALSLRPRRGEYCRFWLLYILIFKLFCTKNLV